MFSIENVATLYVSQSAGDDSANGFAPIADKGGNAPEGYINSAVFEIKDTDGYFRIEVIDEKGQRANTQAYFLDEMIIFGDFKVPKFFYLLQ